MIDGHGSSLKIKDAGAVFLPVKKERRPASRGGAQDGHSISK